MIPLAKQLKKKKKKPRHRRPAATAKSLQSYLTLCDPIDGSPPGSPAAASLWGVAGGVPGGGSRAAEGTPESQQTVGRPLCPPIVAVITLS